MAVGLASRVLGAQQMKSAVMCSRVGHTAESLLAVVCENMLGIGAVICAPRNHRGLQPVRGSNIVQKYVV